MSSRTARRLPRNHPGATPAQSSRAAGQQSSRAAGQQGSRADRDAERGFIEAAERACRREIDLVVESPNTSVILRRQVAIHGRERWSASGDARREVAEMVDERLNAQRLAAIGDRLARIDAVLPKTRAEFLADRTAQERPRLGRRLDDASHVHVAA